MATYAVEESKLTAIADAIRLKRDILTPITIDDMPLEISLISGSDIDWSEIGYSEAPEVIQDGFDHALEIKENWINETSLLNRFLSDGDLLFMPMVDTSNATNMTNTFYRCRRLINFPLLNTSSVTNMSSMFYECWALKEVPLLDTSNVSIMTNMFANCASLESVPAFDTQKLVSAQNMFYGCSSLKEVPLLDFKLASNVATMFVNCTNLTTLGGFKDLGQAYPTSSAENYSYHTMDLSYCNALTHDSIMNVITNLYDIASKGCNRQLLKLGATNLAKLSSAEIAIATNKGWNVL